MLYSTGSRQNYASNVLISIITTVEFRVKFHALQTTMLSNKAEEGLARNIPSNNILAL